MEERKFNLRTKITFFTFLIIMIAIVFISIFFYRWTRNSLRDEIQTNNMNMAINIGNYTHFGDLLESEDKTGEIQKYTQKTLENTKNIDFIVISNMDSIRYSHPIPERVGRVFVGGDESRVKENGETYFTEEVGTLGRSIRAFSPVFNSKGQQTGFVVIGTLLKEYVTIKNDALGNILIYSLGGIVIGLFGAFILTYNIKRSLLGLEPNEISRIYTERTSMLEAIQEGIISIDVDKKVTTINDSAKKILNIKDENPIGKKASYLMPNNKMEYVLDTEEPIIGKERNLNGAYIVTNIVPIKDDEKTIGVVATFRDRTEATKLAEEITGYTQIVNALRANSHEFLNKLHIILGLIQIGEVEEAKEFILGVKRDQEYVISSIMKKIKDPILVGLILGKESRAKELGIKFKVTGKTFLEEIEDKNLRTKIITILGNLIENAFEATRYKRIENKKVLFEIIEDGKNIEIMVADNGVGIKEENKENIFKNGYSTKKEGGGTGLVLVKENLDALSGFISIDSEVGKGTRIKIKIRKG